MIEDYVSLETAKLLKKKGFDEATIGYYYTISETPEKIKFFDSPISIYYSDGLIGCIQAPTLQMAMKWLRRVHKIGVFPSTYSFMVGENGSTKHVYGTAIINLETYELMTPDMMPMPTYEEAAEVAIKYCLENLI